jgi:hypothetical protein
MTTQMTGTCERILEVPTMFAQRKLADAPSTSRISVTEILAAWGLVGLIALGVVAADFALPSGGAPAIARASSADPFASAVLPVSQHADLRRRPAGSGANPRRNGNS